MMSIYKNNFIVSLTLVLMWQLSFSINLEYFMKPKQQKCFEEYFVKDSSFLIKITSSSKMQPLKLIISDHRKNILYQSSKESHQYYNESLSDSQSYDICIENTGKIDSKFLIDIIGGFEASEAIFKIKQGDFIINTELNRYFQAIQSIMPLVKNLGREASEFADDSSAKFDDLSNKMMCYSGFTVLSMIIVTILNVKYLRDFFRKKKLI